MAVPTLPDALPGGDAVALWMSQSEQRLDVLENPGSPVLGYVTASANLTVANAALFPNCWVIVSDLKTMAFSTGSHWVRTDTGANIV